MNKRIFKSGFTIVELLVVIVILSTFAILGSFGYNKLKERQDNEKARTNAEGIASALDEIHMSGQTSDGVQSIKGGYPSFIRACDPERKGVIKNIVQKQKSIDKDVKVGFLFDSSAEHPEKISYNLSGCEALPSGEISTSCVDESLGPLTLVTCDLNLDTSFEDATINANDPENIGTIIYQPITNKKASEYTDTTNMAWQCMYDERDASDGYHYDPCFYGGCYYDKKEVPEIIGMKPNTILASAKTALPQHLLVSTQPSIRLAISYDPEEEITSGPTSCRSFYIYYLEKSGGKIKLSEAITGKY